MSAKEQFEIKSYTNPSGEQVWRVQGRLPDGRRVRENKADYAEAVARKAELQIQALNLRVSAGLKRTRLTDQQLDQAEAVFTHYPQLTEVSLSTVVAEFFRHRSTQQAVTPKTVEAACQEFLAVKKAKEVRPRTEGDYDSRIRPLRKIYGSRLVTDLTPVELESLIFKAGDSPVTGNGNRRVLYTFFQWCVKKKYTPANPVTDIERVAVDEKEPEILTLAESKSLLRAALGYEDGLMLPYVALGLLMALRPKELARVSWDDISLDQKVIRLGANVAKLRQRRVIDIPENVVEWLRACQGKPIVPKNWRRRFDAVRRQAGFRGSYARNGDDKLKIWPEDVVRHTAISNFYAHNKNEGATAYWAGNSPDTVHRFYKGLVYPEDAKDFWELKPTNLDAQIIRLPAVA